MTPELIHRLHFAFTITFHYLFPQLHTVRSMTLVLASGTVIDTARPDAEAAFMRAEPDLAQGLLKLRAELIADRALVERVRHKYMIRNTTGYRLDALLDADTPLDIFRRLMVGSEGTLAFIAEVVINTLPTPGATCVTWIPVPSIDEAVALVPSLVSLGAEAVELMVAPALTAAAQAFPGTPEYWRTLDPKAAALLVEFTGAEICVSLNRAPHPTGVIGHDAADGACVDARGVRPQTASVSAQVGAGVPENNARPGPKRKASFLE